MNLMGNYISCSGVSDICFKNYGLYFQSISNPLRCLHPDPEGSGFSHERSTGTSAPDPGVPGMVLTLGEGTVPAQNHIEKAPGVVSKNTEHSPDPVE